jgi:hypothetical protein
VRGGVIPYPESAPAQKGGAMSVRERKRVLASVVPPGVALARGSIAAPMKEDSWLFRAWR